MERATEALGPRLDLVGAALATTSTTASCGVDRARLWSLPDEVPPVDVLESVIGSFREAGGEGKPVHVQIHRSWDDDEDEALAIAIAHDQWRSNVFSSDLAWNLELPAQFDAEVSAELAA